MQWLSFRIQANELLSKLIQLKQESLLAESFCVQTTLS